jgi:methylated-DNA-[protein]-cysteine S-methyltransferase
MADWLDDVLRAHFEAARPPAGLARRVLRGVRRRDPSLAHLVDRFRIEATPRGVRRVRFDGHRRARPAGEGAHAARARRELAEYLAGQRTYFSVPLDLELPRFQARVLAEAARVPFGEVVSYAALAARIGHPRAARAVGNALGANPVPILVPCHRVVRADGTWGHYALGPRVKTALLALERTVPTLVGCSGTRIVCRRGCRHEQRIADERRVTFASVADARDVGYRACRVCRPQAAPAAPSTLVVRRSSRTAS